MAQLWNVRRLRNMRDFYSRIVLIVVGVLLLALGLLNTVPDILRLIRSNASTETLMVKNYWLLAAVIGALLCVISLFIGKKHG